MNIDDLTIKEVRELSSMIGGSPATERHPLVGSRVLAILPGRFIYIGILEQHGSHYKLNDCANVRYWSEREDGLGGLAKRGPEDGDRIDECLPIWFHASEEIALMETAYD